MRGFLFRMLETFTIPFSLEYPYKTDLSKIVLLESYQTAVVKVVE